MVIVIDVRVGAGKIQEASNGTIFAGRMIP
jgi:hypothetical protein